MPQDDNAPLTRADLEAAVHQILERQDRAVELLLKHIEDVRTELLDRLAPFESRTARMAVDLSAITAPLGGISKSLSAAEEREAARAGAAAGQQRAADQLAQQLAELRARVEALEKKAS